MTDPEILAIEPIRLDLVTLREPTTITRMAQTRPSPVPPTVLAIMNAVEADALLSVGRTVKWVVGTPVS